MTLDSRSTPALEPDHAARLFNGRPQVGAGVYDGLSALLAAKWYFDFLWVSSLCCSAAAGLPDAGIIGPEDILNVVRCVHRSVDLPIVVDLDSGYGDPVKVFHVVEAMARAGEALRRAGAYVEAGADAVFIQSLDSTGKEVLTFGREWSRRTPLFIAPTRLPQITRTQFFAAGISHTMFANQGLRAAHGAMDRTFRILAQAESSQPVESEISTVAAVADLVGAQKVVELEAYLAGKPVPPVTAGAKKPARRPAETSPQLTAI
jgi:2-methylisocitrate lyase-like PEP mutase family enzyme